MKVKEKKRHEFLIIVAIFFIIVIASSVFFIFQNRVQSTNEDVKESIERYTGGVDLQLKSAIDFKSNNAANVAKLIAESTDEDDIDHAIESVTKVEGLYVYYSKNGVYYKNKSTTITLNEISSEISKMVSDDLDHGRFMTYNTGAGESSGFCFRFNLKNINPASIKDELILIYDKSHFTQFIALVKNDPFVVKSECSILCNSEGKIVEKIVVDGSDEIHSLTAALQLTLCDESVDEINAKMKNKTTGTVQLLGDDKGKVAVLNSCDEQKSLYVVTVFDYKEYNKLNGDSMATVYGFILFVVVSIIILSIYFIAVNKEAMDNSYDENGLYKKLECKRLGAIINGLDRTYTRHARTKFAITKVTLNFFSYLSKQLGDQFVTDILKNISQVIRNSLQQEENYTYVGNGDFIIFMHFDKKERLHNRLIFMDGAIAKRLAAIVTQFTLKINYLVYEANRETDKNVDAMIDALLTYSNRLSEKKKRDKVVFCSDLKDETYNESALVTLEMQHAFENNEFQVFYQPQYNIKQKRLEGAEALIRWYNPKTNEYRRPASFLPVLEENGFIVKLDKLVFLRVCEFMKNCADNGRRVYPVAVNISVRTAMSVGFVDYFKEVKEKFQIPDNFITVEFTESVACDDYLHIQNLVKRLHSIGIRCSVDDFGSGYSSYEFLKNVNIDEIKVDASFLRYGKDDNKADIILKSIFDMANKLGIKSIQEGVETAEEFERIKNANCDVIQGYLYSKPLILSDYINFIDDVENGIKKI